MMSTNPSDNICPENKRRRTSEPVQLCSSQQNTLTDLLKAAVVLDTNKNKYSNSKDIWSASSLLVPSSSADLRKCDDTTLLQKLLTKQQQLHRQADRARTESSNSSGKCS